jgi:hypothetical protein
MSLDYRVAGTAHAAWKRGRTIDMSAGGILAGIGEMIPVGAALELVIAFPGTYYGRPMVRLQVSATVLRSDTCSAALRILHHQFCGVTGRPAKTLAVA